MKRLLVLTTLLAAGAMVPADGAIAQTFSVTSTDNAGPGTLRQAILNANANGNPGDVDVVRFKIPGKGPHDISITSSLPDITQPVLINGYSEPGSKRNTRTVGSNAKFKIRVVQGASTLSAFRVLSDDTIVRGVGIVGFFVGFFADGSDNRLEGSHVMGGGNMVRIEGGDGNFVGGPTRGQHNLISSGGFPLVVTGAASNTTIQGNAIGTKRNGKGDDGNDRGVLIGDGPTGSIIGGGKKVASNVIAFNGTLAGDDGLGLSDAGTGNRILRNSIHSNNHLGIDLGTNGPTPNDADDPDTGPNDLQNHPVINAVRRKAGPRIVVKGTLDSTPNTPFSLRFYSSPEADPSGFGEGKRFLGRQMVTTDGSGDVAFKFKEMKKVKAGHVVTATAMNQASGDTSEFSNTAAVT